MADSAHFDKDQLFASPCSLQDDDATGQVPTSPKTTAATSCEACRGINFESLMAETVFPGIGVQIGYKFHASYNGLSDAAEECSTKNVQHVQKYCHCH